MIARPHLIAIMAAIVTILLLAAITSAGSTLPPTAVVKAPAPSTTLSSSAPTSYAGVSLATLASVKTPFVENVTSLPHIAKFGSGCIPIHQETQRPPFAYLSITGYNDTVVLVSGDVCTLAIDLGPFYWDFANYTLGAPQTLSGGTPDGLALAFQQYLGQLRFWSHSDPSAAQISYTLPDANLANLTLSPVYSPSQAHTSYADALTTIPSYSPLYGISYVYSMPSGAFDTNTTYIPIPYGPNASLSGNTWSLSIMPSYCDVSNVATSCSYWFGDAQLLFYVLPTSVASGNATGLLLSCTALSSFPLVVGLVATGIVIGGIEWFGRTRR